MWGHQRQMESSQHSCFCWPGLFLLQRFCRGPVTFTRDLWKTDLVTQNPGAGQSGAFHESVWHEKCYFEMSLLPHTHLVFSVFRYWMLFIQSRSEPFLPARHICCSCKPIHRRLLKNLVAWRIPQVIQVDQVWVGWSTNKCPQSLPLFLHYFQTTTWSITSQQCRKAVIKAENKWIRLLKLFFSWVFNIWN